MFFHYLLSDKIEYALVSCDISSLLFEIVKFLLQAIFATMEEELESWVEMASGEGGKDGEKGGEEVKTEAMETEGEDVKKGAEDGVLTDDEMEETEEKPLDLRVQSVRATAMTFAKWSHITQRMMLSELILNPYTCTEVLRLHLLSSGGYAEYRDRNWFRHCRRGGYSDADDPAIALRLRRPDIIDSLSRTSIYDLSPADKIEILSTLCLQLLSYSVTREHIEDAIARAKKARKQIREIQFSEERRKREEKSALYKEKKEKSRLKKQEKEKKKTENSNPRYICQISS